MSGARAIFRHTLALALALALVAACASPALAADITVTLPNVNASPGSLVDIPIQATPGPAGFNILSIDFRLTLDPAVIDDSFSKADGYLQSWGSAYWNGTGTFLAAAAAGTTPIATSGTLVNTAQLRLKGSAVVGTTMPLTFQHFLFNEGSPSVAVVAGSVHVVAPQAGAPHPEGAGLSLALASRNPARGAASLAYTLADARPARLALHAVDGRLVRAVTLAGHAGAGTWSWDLRDAHGTRVRPGVYLASLDTGEARRTLRIVVAE
jgi:hypothetical protein